MKKRVIYELIKSGIILCILFPFVHAQSLSLLKGVTRTCWAKVGDANNDGQNEILFGFGFGNKGPEAIILSSNYTPLWSADIPFEEAPEVTVDIGDVNNDDENEVIIMNASPSDLNSNGHIRIYKFISGNFQLIWSDALNEGFRRIAIGNTDNDPEKEIVIGNSFYDRTLYIYDYQGANTWSKSIIEYVGEDCHGVKIADVDNDNQNEIIVGLGIWPPYSVRIYKYINNSYQMIWQYSFTNVDPYGPGYWLDVGDVDNDGNNEILVCENSSQKEGNSDDVFIFEYAGGNNWNLSWSISTGPFPNNYGAQSPLIGKILNNGLNQFAFISMDTLHVYQFSQGIYQEVLVKPLNTEISPWGAWERIFGGDADNDGNYEVLVLEGGQLYVYRGSATEIFEKPGKNNYTLNLVYPNPSFSSTNIIFNSPYNSKGSLEIYDTKGSLVKRMHIQMKKGINKILWDGKDNLGKPLPSGTYLFQIRLGSLKKEGKLILIR